VSVAAPKNTLLYQLKGRPLTMKRDLSKVPISSVASAIREFANVYKAPNTKPETEAIMFYLANHAMKELAFRFDMEEPLPDWAVHIADEYHRCSAKIAARAFYYMLLITAREARHNGSKHSSDWKQKVKSQFGEGPMMALLHYPDHNDVNAVTDVFDKYASTAPLGDVCRSIVFTHYEGSFHGGYGGPKWGNVSDCMTAFATGQSTAEVMLDTVWTLVHNGGPIFNKGMLYGCYDGDALQQVLDVQRAGMMPRLVLAPTGNGLVSAEKFVNDGAKKFAQAVAEKLGDSSDFRSEPVDWKQVKALGAVGSYSYLIKALEDQKKKMHKGVTPVPDAGPTGYTGMAKPVEQVTEQTHYIIAKSPGLMFKKLSRKELAE
jgi:hypothetical protein